MPSAQTRLIARLVGLVAVAAFVELAFEEWHQHRLSGAVLSSMMACMFVLSAIYVDPIFSQVRNPWPQLVGAALAAILTYLSFQSLLNEWQHDRYGGVAIAGVLTAFFALAFCYADSSYGFGRQAPWDRWLEKRRLARIDRWLAERRQAGHPDKD